ncbi:MAG: ABC transporter ATP-binding protein [Euryarchaeota archaeon TMED85]|nr:MAG: ABC transporter ATP-binding protein [Euryarchaeota archaeon TMED85]|tara:strand:+ start:5076 stop:6872 length:1797 start_codon:yes stop_codon:yes gene_type:complete
MFKLLKQLFPLLTHEQRKQFYALQILVVLMAIMEIAGVASIIPFMALVGNMNQLKEDNMIAQFYNASGVTSESQFVFILGIGVLIMLFISAMISMLTIWLLSMFANKIGAEISDRLFAHYLRAGWLFHASGSSAQLTKKIALETQRVTGGILVPLMQMNARTILAILMVISIFIYEPIVAIIGFSTFTIAYFILFIVVRIRLQRNGRAISKVNEQRFRLMNEGFGGIKDLLLLGRGNDFIDRFTKTGFKLAYSQGTNAALAQVPRYFMELVAFGSMILMVLYLIANHDGNLGKILPILSVYALAAVKLLPAFQQIYSSTASIKGQGAAFESIRQDLTDSILTKPTTKEQDKNYLYPKKQILLENITFSYPHTKEKVLNNLSMSIPVNNVIGIVGPSGSGKSTLIDILLCLIKPQRGNIKVDDNIIDNQNLRSWQNTIGFVAQSIFLSEGSIAENVAFGIPQGQINFNQVQQALKLAYLDEFVQTLEKGIHTKVGERGVQLSGGQRQRIGIARALYYEAEVLIFDEATSSLDGITEKMIMEAIHDFSGKKTIIMIAHRLKTVEKCDKVFFIDRGQVVDVGTYKELISKNEQFKKMAEHA